MTDASGEERRFTGTIEGYLRVIPRPGTPAPVEEFRTFSGVDVIIYLSSWVVTAQATNLQGRTSTFTLRVEDETNRLTIGIGPKRWATTWPGAEIDVRNDPTHDRLTILTDQAFFCSNDPAFFIEVGSTLHIRRTE